MAPLTWTDIDAEGLEIALEQARKSFSKGGIPIGSAILTLGKGESGGDGSYTVLGAGHNEHVQRKSVILHGEMSALENAGILKAAVYKTATLVRLT